MDTSGDWWQKSEDRNSFDVEEDEAAEVALLPDMTRL